MKYRHFQIAAATAALAALPAVAAAQATNVAPSAQTGFYIGAGAGLARADFDTSTFGPPAGTAWDSERNDLGGKGFAGFRFNKYIGVEGGYYYLGKYTNQYAGAGGLGTATSSLDAWVLDAVGFLPITPHLSAIGRLGAVNGQIDTQIVGTTPANLLPVSKRSTNFTWGLGAQLDINNRWALRAEYENFGRFGDSSTGRMDSEMWSASAIIKF